MNRLTVLFGTRKNSSQADDTLEIDIVYYEITFHGDEKGATAADGMKREALLSHGYIETVVCRSINDVDTFVVAAYHTPRANHVKRRLFGHTHTHLFS